MKRNSRYDWRINGKTTSRLINELGLTGHKAQDKFVPERYLFATIDNRLAMLRGLLDSDGYVCPENGAIEFSSASEKLARDVIFLVQSFGGTARLSRKDVTHYVHNGEDRYGLPSYRVNISMPNGINPFLLSRKADVHRERTKYKPCASHRLG